MRRNRTIIFFFLSLSIIQLYGQEISSINATSNFHNIGIEVEFDDQTPEDALIKVYVKESDIFSEVHQLSSIGDRQFAGSIFRLEASTEYKIKLVSSLFSEDQLLTVKTRSDEFPQPSGTVYHVSPDGNDQNSGLSVSESFVSLNKAVSIVKPGNTILLHEGMYHEEITIPISGNEKEPIVIRSASGEKAVLDGRDTSFAPEWSLYNEDNQVYRTIYNSECLLAYYNGKHLYKYSNPDDMAKNIWEIPGVFYCDKEYFYIQFPHKNAPSDTDTVIVPMVNIF